MSLINSFDLCHTFMNYNNIIVLWIVVVSTVDSGNLETAAPVSNDPGIFTDITANLIL